MKEVVDMINSIKTSSVWIDSELGTLHLHVNARASRLVFRAKEDGLHVTLPVGTSSIELQRAIESLRPRLLEACKRRPVAIIDLSYRIDADFLHLSLEQGEYDRFLLRTNGADVRIICPPDINFSDERLQGWLRKVVGEALRSRAKSVLPTRLQSLARQFGLTYRSVKINSSTTRWGSCSNRQDINLSYYLMLLPARLVDYVLLHELTHTRIMNHSEQFWTMLDALTGGQSSALRDELKNFRTAL